MLNMLKLGLRSDSGAKFCLLVMEYKRENESRFDVIITNHISLAVFVTCSLFNWNL